MKIKLYTALAIAAMAALMTSCGDAYWDEGYPQGSTYAFPKPAYTVNIAEGAEIPTSFDVLMTRNNSGAEATITVDVVFSNSALSGPSTVTFAAGSNTSVYTINVDPNVPGGSTFTATFKLAANLYSQLDTIHNKCQFKLVTPYIWENAGSAQVYSDWVGNMGDGESVVAPPPVEVPVQRATNYVGEGLLYRLQSMYYYMEPDYAEENYGIQFVLDADGNPVKLYPSIQMIGESDKSYGDFAIGCWGNGMYNTFFTKDGDTYSIEAQMLCNDGTPNWYMTGMMEYIMFTLSK